MLSSEMLRRVALVRTDFSKEIIAFIIKVRMIMDMIRSFGARIAISAKYFQYEFNCAVTAPSSIWTMRSICHCTVPDIQGFPANAGL
jgi:hypothetical protein